jgi:DNA replication protein DnaC
LAQRLRSLQDFSSLGALQRLTFDTFIPEPSHLAPERANHLRRIYDACRDFALDPKGWIVLGGAYGCGKTHLAAAIANSRLAMGEPALFMVVPDLLDHLRATFSPQSSVRYDHLFEQLRAAPLLILDDLGAQSSTPWAQEKLFQLLNHRYNAQLPTVITTNQRLDELEPRLRSRLQDLELVQYLPILAPDFRLGTNANQSELSTLSLHREQQFHNFDANRSDLTGEERINLQKVVSTCETFARSPRGWLVLSGAYGCGKTHLAAAVANARVATGAADVMFVVTPDLLDYLRAAYSPQSGVSYDRRFEEVRKTPLLVLDDLGTESATPWAREKLFQLLNYRYSALLPTIITTTDTLDAIEPWLRTRMSDIDRCQFCVIRAPGYRGSRSQQQASRQPHHRKRSGDS